MLKMKKMMVGILAMMMVVSMGSINVSAHSDTLNRRVLETGYTEDGIAYTVYLLSAGTDDESDVLSSARIVVTKKDFELEIVYDTIITPPTTYNFKGYVKEYDTTMQGTLKLIKAIWSNTDNTTTAIYRGDVVGTI